MRIFIYEQKHALNQKDDLVQCIINVYSKMDNLVAFWIDSGKGIHRRWLIISHQDLSFYFFLFLSIKNQTAWWDWLGHQENILIVFIIYKNIQNIIINQSRKF